MKELTPLSQVNLHSERIELSHPVPSWINEDRIGMDIHETEQLMNLAAVSTLHVSGNNHYVTEAEPQVAGIDAYGNAMATYGAVSSAQIDSESEKISNSSEYPVLLQNSVWHALRMKLHLNKIDEQIIQNHKNVLNPESWTSRIDAAIRKTLCREGVRNLLVNISDMPKFWAFFNTAAYTANTLLSIFDIRESISNYAISELTYNTLFPYMYGKNSNGKGYRKNLFFPGYELDRALVLAIKSRATTLVSQIPEE